MARKFDLVVVGGGPGGYVAAIRAAQLGFSTALIEREHLGGVCLNWGCIPTKALLHGAELAHTMKKAETFGFTVDNFRFDLNTLVAHSRSVAEKLSLGIASLLKKHGIHVIDGEARVSAKCQLTVTREDKSETIDATYIILATGARARQLPGITVDGDRIWGSREAMTPAELPKRLLVIGAGAIGAEFTSLYQDLGSEVILIEALDRILPSEDEEISSFARKAFVSRGIQVHSSTTVKSLSYTGSGVAVEIVDGHGNRQTLEVDRVIMAVGIRGNIENLGLQELGVATEQDFITIDENCRTNLVGLYAIGDVAGPPWLAHKASHEGVFCVERIAGIDGVKPLDRSRIPGCTYCRPQIASIGMTETIAKQTGRAIRCGRFSLAASGKALAINEPQGFVKTIFDDVSGELLGAHMIGPEVTEQIQGFAIARSLEATEAELVHTVFPHPTLSEAMHESVLDALDIAIHH